jgi:hypothetical protein
MKPVWLARKLSVIYNMLKQGSTTRSSNFQDSCEDNESNWMGISWRSKYSVNI